MGKDKITKYLLLIFFIVIAGLSLSYGIGFWRTSWSIKHEVELVDFINILVTISCALGAAWFVAKKLSEDRFNKELTITDLRKIEEQIGCIVEMFIKYETIDESQKNEILNINSYLNSLINRFEIVNNINLANSNLRERFNVFYRYSTDFDSGNGSDVQNIINEGNQLIKAIRLEIIKVNER